MGKWALRLWRLVLVARLTLLLKILTHYGNLEKNFKFLKEVKILSEFFQSELVCLITNLRQRKAATKVTACPLTVRRLCQDTSLGAQTVAVIMRL